MAATRSSELMRIFDDVFKNKVSYCMLCLRTEKERRLVRPHYISLFVQSLNVPCGLQDSNKRVCYICETRAAGALRVRRAVSFAMSVEHLFHNMTLRRKYQEDVRNHLTGIRTSKDKYIDQRVTEWEQQLSQIRTQTQLLQTEVLVVDSIGVQMTVAEPEGPKEDVYVVPDAVPHSETRNAVESILSEPEIEVDSVIILDDEEDPIDIKPKITLEPILTVDGTVMPKLVPIEKLLESPHPTDNIAIMPDEMQLMIRQPNEPQNFVLHSIVVGPDGDLTVPSLSAKIINGQLIFASQGSNPIQPLENTASPTQTPSRPRAVTQNNRNLESANAIDQVDIILESILKEKAAALLKSNKRTSEIDENNKKKAKQPDNSEDVSARPPTMRADRIDWEDKIPMDVISFMDATDPNAGVVVPGGVAPGGLAAGGMVPGGVAAGGVVPGGVAAGGVVPGGVAAGGVVPGGVAAGGVVPDVALISDIRSLEEHAPPPPVIDLC